MLAIEETFTKRSGTTDVGKDYEDYLAATTVLNLTSNSNIKKFSLSSNDEKYGIFDDLVLEAEATNGEERKYALQLKHKDKSNLQDSSLATFQRDFSIQKYFYGYKKLDSSMIEPFNLILFTNLKFDVPSEGKIIELQQDGKKTIDVFVSKRELFEEFGDGRCYKFEVVGADTEGYSQFFEQFFLYTDQNNVVKMKEIVLNMFVEMFRCERIFAEQYLAFVTNWSKPKGTKMKLNKTFMQQAIAVHLLTPLIKPFWFAATANDKKLAVLREAVLNFNVTVVDEKHCDVVQKLWNNSNRSYKEMKDKKIQFQITDGDSKEKNKLLWLMGECPLIVEQSEILYKVIDFYPNGKFIILRGDFRERNFENASVFQNLADLDVHSDTYKNILEKFRCSLQGKSKISLKTLIGQNEDFRKIITPDLLFQMLDDLFVVGEGKEVLPDPYINRSLITNTIEYSFFDNVSEDMLIVISCFGKFDKVQERLQNFTLVKIKNRKSVGMKVIYVDEDQCSREEFAEICDDNPDKKQFYHFKVADDDGRLEWVDNRGGISDCIHIQDKNLSKHETDNQINVIFGGPGMGKSVLMTYLRNNYGPKFWTILISVRRHSSAFCKMDNSADNFINYLKDTAGTQFDREVFEILEKMKMVTFLWDGLNEISDENLETVLNIIAELNRRGFKQWITCSYQSLTSLEKKVKVSPLRIRPFTDDQLITYIESRLKSTNVQETPQHIQNSVKMVQCGDIMGVTLQIFMLTELFRQNSEKGKHLVNDVFSITNLYKIFVEEQLADKTEEDLERHLKHYEKAALEAIFDEETLEDLDIQWEEDEDDSDFAEIADKKPEFFHFSYVEYFAATYCHRNYKSVPKLKQIISTEKYRNVRFMFDLLSAGGSPPHLAVLYNNLELLKKYSHQLNSCKNRLLQICCFWGDNYHEIAKFLMDRDANVNSRDEDGSAPIHLACANGHSNMVRLLMKSKSTDLNAPDKNGDPPLRVAYKNGHYKIVRLLLLSAETNVNGADKDGARLIHWACNDGNDATIRLLLLIPETKVNAADKEGSTPIHLACEKGHVEAVRSLVLSSETDVNTADKNGARPIHLACINGLGEIVAVLLLSSKIDVNAPDKDGSRPIHLVCERGYCDIARMLLLSNNINLTAGNIDGKTPLQLAIDKGYSNIVDLFNLKK